MNWKKFNGWALLLSLLATPVSYVFRDSVAYVTLLSHLALSLAFLAAWRADSPSAC